MPKLSAFGPIRDRIQVNLNPLDASSGGYSSFTSLTWALAEVGLGCSFPFLFLLSQVDEWGFLELLSVLQPSLDENRSTPSHTAFDFRDGFLMSDCTSCTS